MVKAFDPIEAKNIRKMLKNHMPMCRINLFSSGADRHCTCGRDQAQSELEALIKELRDARAKLQPPLFGDIQ